MEPKVWLVPGLFNSGPEHWQRVWQREHGWSVVEQRDWETPDCSDWIDAIEAAVAGTRGPVVLGVHSAACATIAHWAAATRHGGQVRGALLVAPSDVEAPSYPSGTTGFSPMPMARLPFESVVVASDDDPYVMLPRARAFAAAWKSEIVVVPRAGHLNAAAGYGPWAEGERLIRRWLGGND